MRQPLRSNKPNSPGNKKEGEEEEEDWRPRQDYKYLAKDYERMLGYRQLDGTQPCAMCNRNACQHVFFPCQHKCVCPDCIRAHNIGDTFTKVREEGTSRGTGKHCSLPVVSRNHDVLTDPHLPVAGRTSGPRAPCAAATSSGSCATPDMR